MQDATADMAQMVSSSEGERAVPPSFEEDVPDEDQQERHEHGHGEVRVVGPGGMDDHARVDRPNVSPRGQYEANDEGTLSQRQCSEFSGGQCHPGLLMGRDFDFQDDGDE